MKEKTGIVPLASLVGVGIQIHLLFLSSGSCELFAGPWYSQLIALQVSLLPLCFGAVVALRKSRDCPLFRMERPGKSRKMPKTSKRWGKGNDDQKLR
jgi:hypothetical protein